MLHHLLFALVLAEPNNLAEARLPEVAVVDNATAPKPTDVPATVAPPPATETASPEVPTAPPPATETASQEVPAAPNGLIAEMLAPNSAAMGGAAVGALVGGISAAVIGAQWGGLVDTSIILGPTLGPVIDAFSGGVLGLTVGALSGFVMGGLVGHAVGTVSECIE